MNSRRAQSGFSIVEIVVSMTVVSMIVLGTLSMTMSSITLESNNREYGEATAAVRQVIEELQAVPFEEVFSRFNLDPDDDPDGPGTAIGGVFDLATLEGRATTNNSGTAGGTGGGPTGGNAGGTGVGRVGNYGGSQGGGGYNGSGGNGATITSAEETRTPMAVEIGFPTNGGGILTENVRHPRLGDRDWDLDGDGHLTGASRADDYKVLPVVITISWQSASGPREVCVPRILTANRPNQWSSRYQ